MTELCKCKHCKMLPTLYALDVEGSELEWNDDMEPHDMIKLREVQNDIDAHKVVKE